MKRKRPKRRRPADEGSYVCPTCGEQIVVPLDLSAGDEQRYVEDCPVCCNPNVVHVEFSGEGEPPRVWAEAE
jgi:transcription elongation factor Elf1